MVRLLFGIAALLCTTVVQAQALFRPGMAATTAYAISGDVGIQVDDYVLAVYDIRNHQAATPGQNWAAPQLLPPSPLDLQWKRSRMGCVFGVTSDTVGNIYVASGFMYGMFAIGTAGSGGIYKIKYDDWTVTDLVTTDSVPATSSTTQLPNMDNHGLGNIDYNRYHDLLYVSNFEDGKVSAITTSGIIVDSFDPFQPDVQSTSAADYDELVYGLAVYGSNTTDCRLYFCRWQDTVPNNLPQIWSVALDASGHFTGTERLEIQMPVLTNMSTYTFPVADISFSDDGRMLLTERTMVHLNDPFAHSSRTTEYKFDGTAWVLNEYYHIGNYYTLSPALPRNNACGGGDYGYGFYDPVADTVGDPDKMVWIMGDALKLNQTYNCDQTNDRIYGLAGISTQGNSCMQTDPDFMCTTTILVDLNNDITDMPKSYIGSCDVRNAYKYHAPVTPPVNPGAGVTPCELLPANIITPNGDGINEFLEINCPGTWKIDIYNRWGNHIYNTPDYRNSFNGRELSDGVYYYILESADGLYRHSGFFHILRNSK